MKPKKPVTQPDLFRSQLSQIIDLDHPLAVLAGRIDWEKLEAGIGGCYVADFGRPGCNTRLMISLLYLKHAYDESDESVVARWLENPYWQWFSGFHYFQHECPIDPSSLSRWRQRVGAERLEAMLKATIEAGVSMQAIKTAELEQINVDTTVQEKAIAFPTDARLYHKMRKALVREARRAGIRLRQSYQRVGKRLLIMQGRYAHARQMRRAARMTKRLKTILGRVVRDIQRKARQKAGEIGEEGLRTLIERAEVLLRQTRDSKGKLYSVHAPEVECIAKGKAHKRYEFGCKVSVATSNRGNWILGVKSLQGNPYDGHTLGQAIQQAERITGVKVKDAVCDQGYRGHDYQGSALVHVVKSLPSRAMRTLRRLFRRRAAIEPVIGHLKSDHGLGRNHLRGSEGDRLNAVLSAAGFNLRKLLAAVFYALLSWLLRRLDLYLDTVVNENAN
jgi:IS5 family transposase